MLDDGSFIIFKVVTKNNMQNLSRKLKYLQNKYLFNTLHNELYFMLFQ